jgi:hypothetical protein
VFRPQAHVADVSNCGEVVTVMNECGELRDHKREPPLRNLLVMGMNSPPLFVPSSQSRSQTVRGRQTRCGGELYQYYKRMGLLEVFFSLFPGCNFGSVLRFFNGWWQAHRLQVRNNGGNPWQIQRRRNQRTRLMLCGIFRRKEKMIPAGRASVLRFCTATAMAWISF